MGQLKAAKAKARETEARCGALEQRHEEAVRAAADAAAGAAADAAAGGASSAERHGAAVHVAQLEDELTELRAQTDVEAVARQQAAMQLLFR